MNRHTSIRLVYLSVAGRGWARAHASVIIENFGHSRESVAWIYAHWTVLARWRTPADFGRGRRWVQAAGMHGAAAKRGQLEDEDSIKGSCVAQLSDGHTGQ